MLDVTEELKDRTAGRGPDHCIDCVGMEAYGKSVDAIYDRTKTTLMLSQDRPTALREALQACRKGGTVSIPGVYGGLLDKLPLGAAFAKGLTLKMGQTHVHRYLPALLELTEQGPIDPSFVITDRLTLEEAPEAYETFKHEKDGFMKIVMAP